MSGLCDTSIVFPKHNMEVIHRCITTQLFILTMSTDTDQYDYAFEIYNRLNYSAWMTVMTARKILVLKKNISVLFTIDM